MYVSLACGFSWTPPYFKVQSPLKEVRAQKFPRTDFFKLATQKGPEKYPKSEKSDFVS